MEQYTNLPFMNQKDYRLSLDRRSTLFVASKPKNSCFTCSITHPATTLTFSPADALFLDDKVRKSSSSLCLCTRKIIGHSEWCKMARRCDQVTLKVVFTVCHPMLYPLNGHNLAIQTPLELHDLPNRSQWKVVCVHIPLVPFDNISEARSGM